MHVRLKVFRFDPEKDKEPYYRSYDVEAAPFDRLLDCLNRIRWEQDSTLAFRMSCGHGICGSDGMRINGICGLPCRKLVKEYAGEVLVEPLPVFPVIKDLVVNLEPFFEKYRAIKPYLIARTPVPERERRQLPEAEALLEDAVRCILCGCCTASCPVNQTAETADYTGPAALVRAFRYLFDSRDEGAQERIARLDTRQGAWGCKTLWKCTEVCPRQIPVTKQIGRIKARIFEARKQDKEK
jgi:succinate dehydrogenase / fumarate reductase, iron-sulfur subunit